MARARKKGARVASISTTDFMAATEHLGGLLFGLSPTGRLASKIVTNLLFPRTPPAPRHRHQQINKARLVAKQVINKADDGAIDLGNGVQYIPPPSTPRKKSRK